MYTTIIMIASKLFYYAKLRLMNHPCSQTLKQLERVKGNINKWDSRKRKRLKVLELRWKEASGKKKKEKPLLLKKKKTYRYKVKIDFLTFYSSSQVLDVSKTQIFF